MDVDLIFKIAAVGILVAVLNLLLSRAGRDEQALMTTIAGLVVVLIIIVQEMCIRDRNRPSPTRSPPARPTPANTGQPTARWMGQSCWKRGK